MAVKLSVFLTALAALAAASCSAPPFTEESAEIIDGLPIPDSVNRSAWHWEAPEDADLGEVSAIPGGAAVLLSDGVIAISGQSGEQMWEYHFPEDEEPMASERDFHGEVSDNGEFYTIQSNPRDDEDGPPAMAVIETATGEVAHEYSLSLPNDERGLVRGSLNSVNSDHWITMNEAWPSPDRIVAFELGSDRKTWENSAVLRCDNYGRIDGVVTAAEAVVVGTTCYERPDGADGDGPEMTVGYEFDSTLMGLSPQTGEEIWRTESDTGVFPEDSIDRMFTLHRQGSVAVYHPWGDIGQILDPRTGNLTTLEEGSAAWLNDDATQFTVWDERSRNYWEQGSSGNIGDSLAPIDSLPIEEETEVGSRRDSLTAGLKDGVVIVNEDLPQGTDEMDLAVFRSFDGDTFVSLLWEYEDNPPEPIAARPAPGAVLVSYRSGANEGGLIGLQ